MTFGIGNVLATTFRIWLRYLPRWLLLAIVCFLPVIVWQILLQFDAPRDWLYEHYFRPLLEMHPVLYGYLASGTWIAAALLAAAIASGVVSRMRGQPAGIAEGILTAVRRSPRLFVCALIVRLATIGVLSVLTIALWERDEWYTLGDWFYLGWAVLWVVLMSLWVALLPVIALEQRGVLAAVRRNFALGHRVKVFAIVLVEQVLVIGVNYALYFALMPSMYDYESYQRQMAIYNYVSFGLEVLLASFAATLAAVTYERLRAAKDGPTANELDRVFE